MPGHITSLVTLTLIEKKYSEDSMNPIIMVPIMLSFFRGVIAGTTEYDYDKIEF